jgi:hypothetical protein
VDPLIATNVPPARPSIQVPKPSTRIPVAMSVGPLNEPPLSVETHLTIRSVLVVQFQQPATTTTLFGAGTNTRGRPVCAGSGPTKFSDAIRLQAAASALTRQ